MNRKAKALEFADEVYDIQITGRHLAVTDAMRDYAIEKISKIERFMNRIIDVDVIMDVQRVDHKVEIIMKVGNLSILSKATTNDMYASIDKAVNKLEAQVLRYKSKVNDHHVNPSVVLNEHIVEPLQMEEEEEFEESYAGSLHGFKKHTIVSQEKRSLKTLSFNEAIVKMELSGHPFMLFINEADHKVKVIYRREDGNYGVIEPNS